VDNKRLLLIDGHSMAFRAFYALPAENFVNGAGQHTNAVHGFLSMFLGLLEAEQPSHVAVAFDLPGGTFRTREYPEYKGTRDKTPEAFIGQVELIRQLLGTLNVTCLSKPDFEADDILATLTSQGLEQGYEVLISSGDRDSFQMVTDHSTVLYPVRGVSVSRRMTPQEVFARYGVTPAQYPQLAALVGEDSDNLPGVPGVGPKTAAKWLNRYESLEGIYAHADEIKGKVGQSLRDHLDDVKRNRKLNRLLTDLELDVQLGDLKLAGGKRHEFISFMDQMQFVSLRDKALAQLNFDTQMPPAEIEQLAKVEAKQLHLDGLAGGLEKWLQAANHPLALAVTGCFTPSMGDADTLILSDGAQSLNIDLTSICPADEQALAQYLAGSQEKYVTDYKSTWHALHGRGLELNSVSFDAALAGYIARPDQRGYSVADLSQRWLGIDQEPTGQAEQTLLDLDGLGQEEASADDAALTHALVPVLTRQLEKTDSLQLLSQLELPVSLTLAHMENAGIGVDMDYLEQLLGELDSRVTHAAQNAYDALGHTINLSSPKQLQVALFEELDMPKTRKTKTGYTTNAEALEELYLKTAHPFLGYLLEHRDAIKLRQMVETLRKTTRDDGRIHTVFQQTVTTTGRLSSTEPNMQNIPARSEEGMRIRGAFVPGEGYEALMTADYSQIEMRIMAHLSKDQGLIDAFASGEDLHRYVAALVHGIDPAEVTSQQRSHIKAMSYGLAYGLSTFGLSRQLGISREEAASLRKAYFARFGGVQEYLTGVVKQARTLGYTQTMAGRRRYLPGLNSDNYATREAAERAALNAPIQGTAADIIKQAMLNVEAALREQGLASRILLQVHDELVLEIAPGEAETVQQLVRQQMESAASLSVKLEVGVGLGKTWRDAAH
jgi:DNA-directed DNA polymerase